MGISYSILHICTSICYLSIYYLSLSNYLCIIYIEFQQTEILLFTFQEQLQKGETNSPQIAVTKLCSVEERERASRKTILVKHRLCAMNHARYFILFYFILIYFNFLLFRATPEAYGSSQSRGQIRAAAAGLCHSSHKCQILQPTELRPGIEPASSWILVGFITH